MSDTTFLGRRMRSFRSAPQFDGFSKVTIIVSDEIEYSAGSDLGRTLRLTNPWGTPEMAQDILNSIRGFQYQPYTAEGALLDPAAELGDGVTANNVYGGIYTKKVKFGPLMTVTVAAPEDEEINHEYPYKSKPNKEITREAKMLRASLAIESARITAEVTERKSDISTLSGKLTIQAGQISTEISERKAETGEIKSTIKQESSRITAEIETRTKETENLRSGLDIQAGQIAARVTKSGGSYSSFGWDLTDSYWELQSGSSTVLRADKNGLDVRGKITALSGKIGGFDILSSCLSYNGQTWDGTNTYGAYLGTSGLQLGKNFRVDMAGNLYAASGTFTGAVNAGSIRYGGDFGSFSGSGISGGSIYGDRLVGNTITTAYTSSGINSALANGNWAANLFSGIQDYDASIKIGTVSCKTLYQGGSGFSKKSATIKDYDGNNVTIAYWGW